MDTPEPKKNDSIGYGLFGCAGGLLLGFLGGGIIFILISLTWATIAADPTPPQNNTVADMRVTVGEGFLNRLAQQNATNPVRLDLLPGNQISLGADTRVTLADVTLPVQIQALFGIQVSNQMLELRLIDGQVTGVEWPVDIANLFSADLAKANQDLSQSLQNLSTMMNVPITLTGLGTTETEIWLEVRENP
jgi:hypothetical protein